MCGLVTRANGDKFVVVAGGRNEALTIKQLDVVEVFDPHARRWSAGRALPHPLGQAVGVPFGRRLAVVGGKGSSGKWLQTAYIYNAETGEWELAGDRLRWNYAGRTAAFPVKSASFPVCG